MTIAVAIFDMAGTTVEDRGEVSTAFTAALAGHDLTVSAPQLSALRGASKRDAVLALTPEGPDRATLANAIYESFLALLRDAYTGRVTAVPGAAAVFAELRRRGVKVALNTGFDRSIVSLLIAELDWEGVVDAVVSGDDVLTGRPAPDLIHACMARTGVVHPEQVLNIGDTQLDLRAGAAAKVGQNVGVLTGAHDRATLSREPHTFLVESVREIPMLDFWR